MEKLSQEFEREKMTGALEKVADFMITIGREKNNAASLGSGLVLKGEYLTEKAQLTEAKSNLLEAIQLHENNEENLNEAQLSKAYRNLSNIERNSGNLQVSIEYLERCLSKSNKTEELLKYYQEYSQTLIG